MSDRIPGRIPFEDIAQSRSWSLPEVNGAPINGEEQRQRKTKAGQKKVEQKKRVKVPSDNATCEDSSDVISEDVSQEISEHVAEQGSAITAQQLEEITQAAQQEGFEKGYADGLEQGKVDGRKSGFTEGLKAGTEQAHSEQGQYLKDCGEKLSAAAHALLSPLEDQKLSLANATLDLALGLAQHILDQELSAEPQKLDHIIHQAIQSLPPGEDKISLYLNPEDLKAYRECGPSHSQPLDFFEDSELSRGSCRVESEHSYVDYSVASRFIEFRESLLEQPDDTSVAGEPIPERITAEPEPEPEPAEETSTATVADPAHTSSNIIAEPEPEPEPEPERENHDDKL